MNRMKTVAPLLVLGVSLAGFAALIYLSWEQASAITWTIDWVPLVIAFVSYSLSLGAATLTWHLIFSSVAPSGSFRTNARIYIVSNAARRLPGGIWGIGSRLYLYRLEGFSEVVTSIAIALETAIVGVSVLLVMLVLVPFVSLPESISSNWTVLAVVAIVFAACLHPRVLVRGLNFVSAKLAKRPMDRAGSIRTRSVFCWLAWYMVAWLIAGVMAFFVMRSVYAVPLTLLPAMLGAYVVTGAVSMIVYIAPSGFGITELALAVLLTQWVPVPVAVATPLAIRVFTTASEIAWAMVLIRWR
ncbi:MAG: flippase-like domain-containing protein [Chloroflexi bacterium]|nr:flippase-like domain-containing protein [Chloroflexota bacterium]